jgi:hypothetical protein
MSRSTVLPTKAGVMGCLDNMGPPGMMLQVAPSCLRAQAIDLLLEVSVGRCVEMAFSHPQG